MTEALTAPNSDHSTQVSITQTAGGWSDPQFETAMAGLFEDGFANPTPGSPATVKWTAATATTSGKMEVEQ